MQTSQQSEAFKFLAKGGEMSQLIRQVDWEQTSLGLPKQWPLTLRILLNTLLNSKFPMFLFWGEEFLCFYNDAYRPSLGTEGKHPAILGQPAKKAWPETWEVIKPLLDQVMETGEPTWNEDQLIPIYRNGQIEDAYWTFSYSPAYGEMGTIEGVFVTCSETTKKVISMERLKENEEQFRLAMEAAEMGNWDWNPISGEYQVSERVARWLGRPGTGRVKLADAEAFDPVAPEDRQRLTRAVNAALHPETGGKYDVTYTLRPAEGKERIVRALGKAWFDEEGVVYRFNGVMQDVTKFYAEHEERLKLISLIETSNEFIGLANIEGEIEFLNMAGLRTLGWDSAEGRNIADALYPEDREHALEVLRNMGDRDNESLEIRFLHSVTGEPIWMKWNILVIREPETGEALGYGTVSTNIEAQRKRENDLKRALKQIREQEQRFRNLVKQAPVGISILNGGDYRVSLANEIALKIVDKTEEEVKGVPFFEILPEAKESLQHLLDQVLISGKPSHGTNFPIIISRYGRRDTSYFNFIFNPLREGDGPVTGVICVAMEVTESVILSNQLKESAKQFKNLVIQSPIPMCILRGEAFRVEMANEILLNKIWRTSREKVIGKPIFESFPNLESQRYRELLERILYRGESVSVKESHVLIKGEDGEREFYLDYDYAPLREVDGTVSGIMVTVNDVSENVRARQKLEAFSRELEKKVSERTDLLRSANEQLQESVLELEKTNEELQSFAYISSHDLQEPLRKIQMFSSRILERNKGMMKEKDEMDFQRIAVSATRMRTLIDDLLAFSRTTTSSSDFQLVDLDELVQEVLGELAERIDAVDAEVIVGKLFVVRGIPFQIRQLFSNLLENALKFRREGVVSKIVIEGRPVTWEEVSGKVVLEPGKKYNEIKISDNGMGFKPQFEERIFQVFQRLHPGKKIDGTGIGLAIVKKIVQNHGGSIWAKGKPNEGATFTLYFPRA